MQLQAFAKINLDLRVLGRREDGYHEVRTILQTIDWADEIQIEPADRFEFIEHGVEAGEDNLVVKAVRAFERLTGERSARESSSSRTFLRGPGLAAAARTPPSRCWDCSACTARQIPQPEMSPGTWRSRIRHSFLCDRRQGSRDRPWERDHFAEGRRRGLCAC